MARLSKEYAKKHYEENKQSYLDRTARQKFEKKLWMIGYKDRPCADCGNSYPYYVMDLDHRDPSEKRYEINRLAARNNWSFLKEEVAKCDVVCSNCHRIRTQSKYPPVKIHKRKRGELPLYSQKGLELLAAENEAKSVKETS